MGQQLATDVYFVAIIKKNQQIQCGRPCQHRSKFMQQNKAPHVAKNIEFWCSICLLKKNYLRYSLIFDLLKCLSRKGERHEVRQGSSGGGCSACSGTMKYGQWTPDRLYLLQKINIYLSNVWLIYWLWWTPLSSKSVLQHYSHIFHS